MNWPKEWKEVELKSVCEETDQWNPSKDKREDFFYIDVSAVSNEVYRIVAPAKIPAISAPGRARKMVHHRDVIFATIRPTLRRIALVDKDYDEQIASTAFCVLRANRKYAVPEFLFNSLLSDSFNAKIAEHQHGASYPAVSDRNVLEQTILLPPLPEQRKIAAVLFKIRKAIELQDAIIERTRELKKTTMEFVFTHGLRGEKTKQTEIGEMPESWEIVSISECADVTTGGTPARTNETFWFDGTIPWVKTGEINYQLIEQTAERVTEAGLANSATRLYSKGTLLIAMYGEGVTRGRVALLGIEAATNQACAAVTPKCGLSNEYLYCYLMFAYERLRNQAHGANQQNLNTQLIKNFAFPKPDSIQQREISEVIHSVDRNLSICTSKKKALKDLFKTMLNKLMSGQVRVKDLEIEDVEGEA